jgi:hypothetical protein
MAVGAGKPRLGLEPRVLSGGRLRRDQAIPRYNSKPMNVGTTD